MPVFAGVTGDDVAELYQSGIDNPKRGLADQTLLMINDALTPPNPRPLHKA